MLRALRDRIDEIDEEILSLLDSRMEMAELIAGVKENMEKIHVENREEHVLDRAGVYRPVYEEIVELSKEVQYKALKDSDLSGE